MPAFRLRYIGFGKRGMYCEDGILRVSSVERMADYVRSVPGVTRIYDMHVKEVYFETTDEIAIELYEALSPPNQHYWQLAASEELPLPRGFP